MSISVNRILSNKHNRVSAASLTASAQRASDDVRLVAQSRQGGGRLVVSGSYTGAADAVVDVEVVSGSGGALTPSAPVIRGVGNGVLSIDALDVSAVPESLTFALLDAGTEPVPAALEFYGAALVARAAGVAGNALALSVTRNLTLTPMQYATIEPIAAGTDSLEGPQWDWGQPAATDAGIPDAALRVQFEGFPAVHRAWKTWEGGRFVYRLDPATAYEIPADVRLLQVAGDYALSLTDGVSTELYTAVTIYEFLAQVEARSALARVRGLVARDTAPGGMAVTDIPLRTDAHALPATGGVVEVVSVASVAPTENLVLTYAGQSVAPLWTVRGGVSGELPAAVAGELYTSGPVQFRIPLPASNADGARISALVQLASREADEGLPALCFKPLTLGAAATDKSITFTYRKRPPADCVCADLPALNLSGACLGLDVGGTGMALDAAYQTRLVQLYAWRAGFVETNTGIKQSTSESDRVFSDRTDIEIADQTVRALASCLSEIYEDAGALAQWDAYWAGLQTDLDPYELLGGAPISAPQYLPGLSIRTIQPSPSESSISLRYIRSSTKTGRLYRILGVPYAYDSSSPPESLGATEPNWVGSGPWVDSTTPSISYEAQPYYWKASQAVALGDKIDPGTGYFYVVKTAGVTGTTEPTWPTEAGDITDGTAVWELAEGRTRIYAWTGDESWPRLVGSMMDHVRAMAGIVPKSDASSAGASGGSCWRDFPEADHWWVDESGEYLPAFTNEPYVSAVLGCDGTPASSKEFGFGIVTACERRIKDGDKVTITIRGTGMAGYKQGDKIVIPVVAASSAPFVGGAAGDPTQTWTVRGTVSGALPDWLYNPSAPAPYVAGPVEASLAPGGIPFEVGDAIDVSIEGGSLRWRRDGGAWTVGDLFGATHALGDGLSLVATPGAAPSFVAGDSASYQAVATYGTSRMRQPRIGQGFAWSGAAVTIDVDLLAVHDVEAVLLGLHTLPAGCAVTISGGVAAVGEWTATPAWHASAVLAVLPAGTAARYLRVVVTGAGAGGSIGWLWAGVGWQPSVGASDLTMRRQYGLARGQGINPAALYRGRGTGGAWRWELDQGGALIGANVDALLALVDHTAEQGMEPVCIVPDVRVPARAAIAVVDADEIVLTEHMGWQAEGVAEPMVSVELPFRAVLA
jgi:hypothetical protein